MFINPPNPRKMVNVVFAPQVTLLHHGDGCARVVFGIAHCCNLSNSYGEELQLSLVLLDLTLTPGLDRDFIQ